MALSFNGLQPVTFGDKECMPKMDTETKMRLSQLKKYDSEADEVLASAFPDEERYVKNFLVDKMTIIDKEMLHAYLLGGETMVSAITNKISEVANEN